MFSSVLIANRGEIAVRIIRTARALGMRTIAVYSGADAGALHAEMADEAYLIGPAEAAQSYLSIRNILAAAKKSGAECIHPGYGFLSENADFAESCAQAGIAFIGPPADAIRAMGAKDEAKSLMAAAEVPVVPGYHGDRQDPAFLREKAYEIGYPVLIKAVAGGGGRGMRRVDKHGEFPAALESARREAKAAFGDDRLLLERHVASARHIEIQVLADGHGNFVHLFERDCSLQRRHQKVIEEAPAPGMNATLRAAMCEAALRAARAVDYRGAGTVEFIVDVSANRDGLLDGTPFYFLEMNTRLQVEHPVTEAITGVDLVEAQFRVAAGEPLPFSQDDIAISGHAVEARIYAEDTENGFLPSSGRIEALDVPQSEGLRIDGGYAAGDLVSPHYDALIAKLIASGTSRKQALERLAGAMRGVVLAGPRSNTALLARLAEDADFHAGRISTDFIESRMPAVAAMDDGTRHAVAALGALHLLETEVQHRLPAATPPPAWAQCDAWQLSGPREQVMTMLVDGVAVSLDLHWENGAAAIRSGENGGWPELDATLVDSGYGVYVAAQGRTSLVQRLVHDSSTEVPAGGDASVRAPMHGRLIALEVVAGSRVAKGERLCTVEAMKMEHDLRAPFAGTVSEVRAALGEQVGEGQVLVVIHVDEQGATPPSP